MGLYLIVTVILLAVISVGGIATMADPLIGTDFFDGSFIVVSMITVIYGLILILSHYNVI